MEGLNYKPKDGTTKKVEEALDASSKVRDTDQRSIAIVNKIREKYTLTEEVGILRKVVQHMVEILHIDVSMIPEFEEYNRYVEAVKQEVSESQEPKEK